MTDTKKIVIALVISLVALAGIIILNSEASCTDQFVTGESILTGETRQFTSPCSLPFGWKVTK